MSLENVVAVWNKLVQGGLPQGQLSFLIKAGSDTLPTPMNLKRMRIQCNHLCKLCKNPRPTTAHILSGCSESLIQGRYTWRHDSVLKSLVASLKPLIPNNVVLYADLDGYRYDDSPPSTIPSHILVTPLRPDLVMVSSNDKQMTILELTIPSNTPHALLQARQRKQDKIEYNSLVEDISSKGWSVVYDTVEIGSLGHFSKDTILTIKTVLSSILTDSSLAISQSHKILLTACWNKKLAERGKKTWAFRLGQLLDSTSTSIRFDCRESFCDSAWSALADQYLTSWRNEVSGEEARISASGGRLVIYRVLKSIPFCESYVRAGLSVGVRRVMAGLRAGCLPLQVELGRYTLPKTPYELRICKLCNTEVETQEHFLIRCFPLKEVRKKLFECILVDNPNFLSVPDQVKCIILLDPKKSIYSVCKLIFSLYVLRNNLLY